MAGFCRRNAKKQHGSTCEPAKPPAKYDGGSDIQGASVLSDHEQTTTLFLPRCVLYSVVCRAVVARRDRFVIICLYYMESLELALLGTGDL